MYPIKVVCVMLMFISIQNLNTQKARLYSAAKWTTVSDGGEVHILKAVMKCTKKGGCIFPKYIFVFIFQYVYTGACFHLSVYWLLTIFPRLYFEVYKLSTYSAHSKICDLFPTYYFFPIIRSPRT